MKVTQRVLPRAVSMALAMVTICAVTSAVNLGARAFEVPLLVEPETVTVDVMRAEKAPDPDKGLDGVRQRTKDTSPAPDDTGRNARDRDDQTLTPMDQSSDPRDLKLTQDIRRALMADKTLSTTAKNIKIITTGGTVTLRGPVTSAKERAKIAKKANAIAKGRVDDQLEVTTR